MKTDSNSKRVKVLEVGIDDVSKEEALKIVEGWLVCHSGLDPESIHIDPSVRWDDKSKLIFTPGPEFLVTAQKDPEFKKILNSDDLNLPDGYGLKIFGNITNIIPGVEFMLALCEMATKKSLTVGLLGGSTGVAKKTKEKLEVMFPEINITFAIDGQEADRLIGDYDALRYVDILFVALGHPKQEKFLYRFRVKPGMTEHVIPAKAGIYFKIGMGVGGSFDLISGKLSRAPKILQKLGLEWFWRLIQEPERFKRIFRATVIFPLMVFKKNLLL